MRFVFHLFVVVAAILGLGLVTSAYADTFDVTSRLDATEVELGDTVTYTLEASSSGDAPSDARLDGTGGLAVVGQRSAPSYNVSIINGRTTSRRSLSASWTVRTDKLGTFTIGPASVAVGGARRSGPAQRFTVIAPGQGKPKPRSRGQGSPFDPFAGSPFDPFGNGSPFGAFKNLLPQDDEEPEAPRGLQTDSKLALDAPRAPLAFLHATVDKTHAVVGEQVTLNVYLYEDVSGRQVDGTDAHEPAAVDFLKRSLMQDESHVMRLGIAMVGGRPWSVSLVRKNALFPLKTGKLSIGPMSLTLVHTKNGKRESEPLSVNVTEPPLANRPAGYQVGDTGDFSLSATTTPNTIEQHGAVGVTVELRGTGNMPSKLPLPEVAGVEWLEPETHDALGPMESDRFGGTRTFSYVARIHRDGAVDLGEIRLPFFNPQTRTYGVARAALGIVQVTKSDAKSAPPDVADQVLPNLPSPRTTLAGTTTTNFLSDKPLYWLTLLGMPLACALGIVMTGVVRRARERRKKASPSPSRLARERRAEAEAALAKDDGTSAVAAVERAVEAIVLAVTGINLRGTSPIEARGELGDAGVSVATAEAITKILSDCQDARFAPQGVDMLTARALWQRATAAIDAIGSARPASRSETEA